MNFWVMGQLQDTCRRVAGVLWGSYGADPHLGGADAPPAAASGGTAADHGLQTHWAVIG